MAGEIFAKERSVITLTSSGSSLTNGSAGLANGTADLDARAGGNVPDDLRVIFELTCQWATITGITNNSDIAQLFLVPSLDGTNFPDVDTTSGASNLPGAAFVDVFVACKAPTANTATRFVTRPIDIDPLLYRPYIRNASGQTISANWTLKAVAFRGQYS